MGQIKRGRWIALAVIVAAFPTFAAFFWLVGGFGYAIYLIAPFLALVGYWGWTVMTGDRQELAELTDEARPRPEREAFRRPFGSQPPPKFDV